MDAELRDRLANINFQCKAQGTRCLKQPFKVSAHGKTLVILPHYPLTWATTSCCTRGVAVAVSASSGTPGKRCLKKESLV